MSSISRRLLQTAVAIGGIVPISAGMAGILLGPSMIDNATGDVALDSHFRYLSGLLLAIGMGFWTTIPRIEANTQRFMILTMIVVCGGLARLYALLANGVPDASMCFALGMELLVTPLLALWQRAVANNQRA